MALIAHYPLNGDTKDYSGYGNDGTVVGDTVFIMDGKIGEAVRFNKKSSYITSNHKHVDSTNDDHTVSICMWVKLESFVGESWLVAQYSGGGANEDRAILSIQPNGLVRYFIGGKSIHSNTIVPVSEWFHVGVIKQSDGLIRIYLNGYTDGGGLVQGKWRDTDTVFGNSQNREMPFELNDIRIYDHTLSDKEVKEIAKAKVLHYKFDDSEEPTENLLSNTLIPSTHTRLGVIGWENAGTGNDTRKYIQRTSVPVKPNTAYTLSFKYWSSDKDIDDVYLRMDGTGYPEGNVYIQPASNQGINPSVVTLPNGLMLRSGSFTTTPDTTSITQIFYDSDKDGRTVFIGEVQLEEKSYATPFAPTSRLPLVKDSSGFGNDGTVAVTTAPTWSEDSPVGRGSMKFSGSLITTGKIFYNSEQTHTVSAWVKPTNSGISNQQLVNFHQGYRLIYTSSSSRTLMYMNSKDNDHFVYGSKLTENKWTHVTWVYDKSSLRCQVYYDGILHASSTNFETTDVPSGFEATTKFGTNFVGNISDVRIYATALTPEDILELYQTRASVDNEGNLFVQEIDEISNTSKEVDSRGIARFKEFNEVGRPVRYIRDWLNGSTSNTSNHWVEIQAIDPSGSNVAIGKSSPSAILTDGSTATNPYYSAGSGLTSVTVDLGTAHNITYLHIWHYWSGGRTYHNTKTEVSTDGTNWVTVFDSAVEGEYAESSEGKKILLYLDKVSIGSDGYIYTNEIMEA